MTFYRSDTVNHYKLIIPRENSWAILNELGTTFWICQAKPT